MTSFGTGILLSLLLATGAYFIMQTTTVDMVQRWETSSTNITNIWEEGTFRHLPGSGPDGS